MSFFRRTALAFGFCFALAGCLALEQPLQPSPDGEAAEHTAGHTQEDRADAKSAASPSPAPGLTSMGNRGGMLAPPIAQSAAQYPAPLEAAGQQPDAAPEDPRQENPLPRANPGYIQWLERQSLLRNTPELTAIVTGSSLPWSAPSTVPDRASLLGRASVWLDFNPYRAAWEGSAPALEAAIKSRLPERLAALGIHGLFLSPAAESGASWGVSGAFMEGGRDSVSFAFAQAVGRDADYARLEEHASAAQVLLGGDALPAATGLGPDFALATRGVRDYPGLYIMVEVPAEAWPLLPLSLLNEGNAGRPVTPAGVKALAAQGIIPPAFSRDQDPAAKEGGWAATPELVGVDGVNRRWLYRSVGSTLRPVLNWDDPSGAARRVLSASVIRQVGMLHQPLVGLSLEAMWGQDPAPADTHADAQSDEVAAQRVSGEPALSALRDLSREIRRYGGWSLLRDPFPADRLSAVLESGVDFAPDTVTTPGLEYALLTADPEPLKRSIDASLKSGLDHARLWRAPANGEGLSFRLYGPGSLSAQTALANVGADASWRRVFLGGGDTVYATAAMLAAAASGVSFEDAHKAASSNEKARQAIQRAHLLQIAFRAMQPGLLVLSGQDLEGTLFALTSPETLPSEAAWSLDGTRPASNRQGVPLGETAYPPLDAQLAEKGSFARDLEHILAVRAQTGVATGTLTARLDMAEPAAVGVVTALPGSGYVLVAGNFSGKDFITDVSLPGFLTSGLAGGSAKDLLTGNTVAVSKDRMRLRMDAWEYRIVLFPQIGGAGQARSARAERR